MTSNATADGLRTALSAYVERAIAVLADACREIADETSSGMSTWVRASDDAFILRDAVEPGWQLCIALNEELLSRLPEHEEALRAIEHDEAAARHADTMVGTDLSAHRVTKTSLANRLIWRVAERTGGLRFDSEILRRRTPSCGAISTFAPGVGRT